MEEQKLPNHNEMELLTDTGNFLPAMLSAYFLADKPGNERLRSYFSNPFNILGETANEVFFPVQLENQIISGLESRQILDIDRKKLESSGLDYGILIDNLCSLTDINDELGIKLPVFNASGNIEHSLFIPLSDLENPRFMMYFPMRFNLVNENCSLPILITSNPFYSMIALGGMQFSFAISPYIVDPRLISKLPTRFAGRKVRIMGKGFSEESAFSLAVQLLAEGAEVSFIPTPAMKNFGAWARSKDSLETAMKFLLSRSAPWETIFHANKSQNLLGILKIIDTSPILRDQIIAKLARIWEVPIKSITEAIRETPLERAIINILKKTCGATFREIHKRFKNLDRNCLRAILESLESRNFIQRREKKGIRGPQTEFYTCDHKH